MVKSMRCKREKRLRSIKREIVEKEPFYTTKEASKLAVQAAALAAPKLPVIFRDMTTTTAAAAVNHMDVDTSEGNRMEQFLKPSSRKIGKNMKKKIKIAKKKNHGKGKIRRKNI